MEENTKKIKKSINGIEFEVHISATVSRKTYQYVSHKGDGFWWLIFSTSEYFACCGTEGIFGFSILGGARLDNKDWKTIEIILKQHIPGKVYTFAVIPDWSQEDSPYSKDMTRLYNMILKLGTVVSEFKNPNTDNMLKLVQFTPNLNDEVEFD